MYYYYTYWITWAHFNSDGIYVLRCRTPPCMTTYALNGSILRVHPLRTLKCYSIAANCRLSVACGSVVLIVLKWFMFRVHNSLRETIKTLFNQQLYFVIHFNRYATHTHMVCTAYIKFILFFVIFHRHVSKKIHLHILFS